MKNALRDSAAGKEKFFMVFWLQMDQLGWLQEERKCVTDTWKSGSNSDCEAELIETEYVQVVIVSGGVVFRFVMKLGVDQDNQKRVAGLEKQSCRFLQVGCRFLKVFSERRHKADAHFKDVKVMCIKSDGQLISNGVSEPEKEVLKG
ncbi:hypothetical protein YC2023_022176 [Brassica napus]